MRSLLPAVHRIGSGLQRAAGAVFEAVFPCRCLICGKLFDYPDGVRPWKTKERDRLKTVLLDNRQARFKNLMASYLCPECAAGFKPIVPPFCIRCGGMLSDRELAGSLCGKCIKYENKIRRVRSAGIYDHSLMEAIQQLKYAAKIPLARPLGRLLFALFVETYEEYRKTGIHHDPESSGPIDIVMPVPLHRRRFRTRGFNQAWLLVREWPKLAAMTGHSQPSWIMDRHTLIRNRQTPSQTRLSRSQRRANVKSAFSIRDASRIRHKSILLVDDVYTTGATVEECAAVLIQGGARQVDVLTLARAL